MAMKESHEIRTLEEFRGVTAQRVGVVVVSDTATGTKAHHGDCRHVTEENFTAKVIDGRSKNGHYYAYLRFEDAARETRAAWCQTCR